MHVCLSICSWVEGVTGRCWIQLNAQAQHRTHTVRSELMRWPINLTGGNHFPFLSDELFFLLFFFFLPFAKIISLRNEWNGGKEWNWGFLFNKFTWYINDLTVSVGYYCFPLAFLLLTNIMFLRLYLDFCVKAPKTLVSSVVDKERKREPTLPLICATGSFRFLFFFIFVFFRLFFSHEGGNRMRTSQHHPAFSFLRIGR